MAAISAISGRAVCSVLQQRVSKSVSCGGNFCGIFGRSPCVHTRLRTTERGGEGVGDGEREGDEGMLRLGVGLVVDK